MYLEIDNKKIKIEIANTFSKKLIGFMGKSNFNYGILFPNTNSIHTFCMKENIDVIGLNENNEIIYKNVNMPKNKIATVNGSIKKTSILELPKNTSINLHIGDILAFKGE